jgi:hypothetical protein
MFKACRIKLYSGNEWIFVRLGGPLPVPLDRAETKGEFWDWVTKYHISGQFSVNENSVTQKSDPGKFVISQTKWPDAFWAYSVSDQEVTFFSKGKWGGGGLGHGETETRFTPLLTLHQARLTSNGVKPISATYTGKATVKVGGNMQMLRQGSTLDWEYRRWDGYLNEG